MTTPFQPRPSQARILEYTGGKMGVSAVPGSGKTTTLSALAAKLVREANLARGQQILVVTLVNSARGKFDQQVRLFLGENNLGSLYRVRTLHGLANDIVSERPGLVGLANDFRIMDEFESKELVREAALAWFDAHREFGLEEYVKPEYRQRNDIRFKWRDEAVEIALEFIKKAKDMRKGPEPLREALGEFAADLPLAEMCVNVYEAYERGLRYRASVDFQDLIRLALGALDADSGYLDALRHRWPYLLEDEAQDSSKLQEQILRQLAGEHGNWVRVGDPNQAIYETFTTANPEYLRAFLKEPGVEARELPESGRSAPRIIALANRLIEWSLQHPNQQLKTKQPLSKPLIQPAENNPVDPPSNIKIMLDDRNAEKEREDVAKSVRAWLAQNPEKTTAILTPTNASGAKMGEVLRKFGVPYVEVLRTTTSTRETARALYQIARFLTAPAEPDALGNAFRIWAGEEAGSPEALAAANVLKKLKFVEQYVAPRDRDWLYDAISKTEAPGPFDWLDRFRLAVGRWQQAVLLPIDQLLLTIGNDLFRDAAEIATAYSIAVYLRGYAELNPELRFAEYVAELGEVVRNNRKFTGLGEDDEQFDPTSYKGQAVVITHHKAKGLEWDRVYLTAVNNYDFPSLDAFDTFQGERYFARDSLNLGAEAFAQLKAIVHGEDYYEGEATRQARMEYAAERLRLLYVGITRAREELTITWNKGVKNDLRYAKPLAALSQPGEVTDAGGE
jgi:DNA helicase-2/ATP-dependent DNA helicase PcrA